MRALDPEVGDAVWAGIEPLIPEPVDDHPLGCHRPRADNRDCFEVMLVRLVTGCSWEERMSRPVWNLSDGPELLN
jgi:transposase